jgi:hypothetical protein
LKIDVDQVQLDFLNTAAGAVNKFSRVDVLEFDNSTNQIHISVLQSDNSDDKARISDLETDVSFHTVRIYIHT